MAKKKYIKDEKGIVRASTTNTLGLEKPLLSDNYDINVHNSNMDKIDIAIQDVKGKVDGLELKAEKVTIADTNNCFESNNVEGALNELDIAIQDVKGKVDGLELKAEKVTIADTNNYFTSNNVEGALNELAGEINGQRVKLIDSVNKIVVLKC